MAEINLTKLEFNELIKEKGIKETKDLIIEKVKQQQMPMASERALIKSLQSVKSEFQKLNKNKMRPSFTEDLKELSNSKYVYPKPSVKKQYHKPLLVQAGKNERNLSESLYYSTISLSEEVNELKKDNEKLVEATKRTNEQKIVLKRKLKLNETEKCEIEKKIRKIETNNEVQTKRLLLKNDLTLSRNTKLHNENKDLKRQQGVLSSKIFNKSKQLKLMKLQSTYIKKVHKLKTKVSAKQEIVNRLENELVSKETVITSLRKEKADLIEERDWLAECISNNNEAVVTFDGYKYSYELQKTVYELLGNQVSARNIPGVINSVCKLVGKSVSHLPSHTTINNMNVQRLIVSQKQVGEQFGEKQDITLLSDETTKSEKRMEGMHCSDSEGREWVLGLREIETKAARNVFSTFQEILCDIDEACESSNEKSRQILANIVARVSDRAATETKLGELIEQARSEILPIVYENYDDLSEDEKTDVGSILVFSCGLHGLVHMAESANKTLIECEKVVFDREMPPAFDVSFVKKSESATVRLIRTCSKAFAKGGD